MPEKNRDARMREWPSPPRGPASWRRLPGATGPIDLLLVSFLALALLARTLTDDLSAPESRHSGSLNLSGLIAIMFILLAIGLLLRRHRAVVPTALAVLWLCIWTAVAVSTRGASAETVREGVREVSVVALVVIVYNMRDAVSVPTAARLVQFIGFVPAVVALYQLGKFTGDHRSYGTFAHPDGAAMFFAIATIVSLWLYLDTGRRRSEFFLVALFAAALVATFSIDGLITLVSMLVLLGALHPGSWCVKLVPCLIAAAVTVAFFASPLGSRRVASESLTSGGTAEPNSSLDARLKKWKMLIPVWERSPLFGQGLGTTTTEGKPGDRLARKPPHNEYLRYLVETGVVGLLILLMALAIMIRALLVLRRRVSGAQEPALLTAPVLALVVVAGCLVNGLADNTLLASPTCYAAALIIGAVLTLPVSGREPLPPIRDRDVPVTA